MHNKKCHIIQDVITLYIHVSHNKTIWKQTDHQNRINEQCLLDWKNIVSHLHKPKKKQRVSKCFPCRGDYGDHISL